MKKELEDYLWNEIGYAGNLTRWPRDVIAEMLVKGWIASPKQAWATLDKWIAKGIYDYGVCKDLGWKQGKRPTDDQPLLTQLSPIPDRRSITLTGCPYSAEEAFKRLMELPAVKSLMRDLAGK